MNSSGSVAAISSAPNPMKPLVRGRSLTDMLRGLVIQPSMSQGSGLSSAMSIAEEQDSVSPLDSATATGKPGLKRRDTIDVIPTSQLNDSPQPINVNLGRLVESQGMTAAANPASAIAADNSAGNKSWSFFWKTSAQKVIDNNRQATPGIESGTSSSEPQNKILGAYLSQTDGPSLGVSAGHQQGLISAATQGMTAQGVPQGAGGVQKGGLFNLPDKMNVRRKEVNMFSPSSF